jgi:hypothetical protein
MSEEEKYIQCKNCHQNISESKIFLHEGFCLRNNKLCPECDKVFLVQEFEEHFKTHNIKKPPEKIPQKISPITEHRKNCHHKENPEPKKQEIKVDDNLGFKQCEYCTNMFENLESHLKKCEIKKLIEAENAKYYSDLEKRKKEDDNLAQKLSKEKYMDISKDEEMAKNLQKEYQKQNIDFSKDEEMAKNLQKEYQKQNIDFSKDEEMAKNLQKEYQKQNIDFSKDEELARKLQNQFGDNINISNDEKLAKELQNQLNKEYNNNQQSDEEYARMLQQQERANNNYNYNNNNPGPYSYGFNYPYNMTYNNNQFQ